MLIKVINCMKSITQVHFSRQTSSNGSHILKVKTIPITENMHNYMYFLTVRFDEPERVTYLSTRKQADGKTYETDIQFSSHKPGEKITDLKLFIHEFCSFCN